MRAVRILGALRQHILPDFGSPYFYFRFIKQRYEQLLDSTRKQLDEATFASAFAEGRLMSLEEAIDYALAETEWRVIPLERD